MKRGFRGTRFVGIVLIGLLFVSLVAHISSYLFFVEGYSCQIDKTISQDCSREIVGFINSNKTFRNLSLDSIALSLKNNFPIISEIEVFKSASGILKLKIQAKKPTFLINHEYVLSKNGPLIDMRFFSEDILLGCRKVEIRNLNLKGTSFTQTKGGISDSCKNMINKLRVDVFDSYEVIWENTTKGWLIDKSQNKFAILFNDLHVPDIVILSACQDLKKRLESKGEFCRRHVGRWIADVRFKDQIVLFKD